MNDLNKARATRNPDADAFERLLRDIQNKSWVAPVCVGLLAGVASFVFTTGLLVLAFGS